ncbi:MAG: putative bifunctional diguanylate cyclase/phosphodiesterase [Pseudolabrys sp.]
MNGKATAIAPGRLLGRVRSAWWAARFSTIALVAVLTAAGTGAVLLGADFGYGLARQSDQRHADERRAALRAAVGEFRSLFDQSKDVDPRFVRMIEQSTGLKDVRFERDPEAQSREMQPVLDANGRIAGFLTWQPDWPITRALGRLMPLLMCGAFGLLGVAGFSLWQWRRVRTLAASEIVARHAAETDLVTGLPNFQKTLTLLDAALAARAGQPVVTFALLKLTGVSDRGERNRILAAAGTRLKGELPQSATLGRAGLDEFAVVMSGDIGVAERLRAAIDSIAAFPYGEGMQPIAVQAGFAQAPRDATSREELTGRAEMALRAACRKGPRAVVGYEPSIDTIENDHNFIRRELPRAISAGALDLHYQPIVASDGARIVGVEALLRWTHAERGAVGPAVFVPVAEQMGLMDTLGAFVLRRALIEARRWPDLYVSVNLSPVQVRDRAIVDLVREVLAETGVPPSRLMLEITEGVLIDNPDEMVKRIQDLRGLGVRIALDDFGSGYSSLGYLQRFPFDKLKIDRSFVAPLGKSPNGSVILQAIVALGRALGVTVLVEGVETEQQRVLLRLAGCDEMQGYLFARPAPAKAIDRLLAQRKPGPHRPAPAQKLTA